MFVPGRRNPRGGWGGRLRALLEDQPSPIELVAGETFYQRVYVRAAGMWMLVMSCAAIVALLVPHSSIEGLNRAGVLSMLAVLPPLALCMVLRPASVPPRVADRFFVVAIGYATVIVSLVGPNGQMSTTVLTSGAVASFVLMRRRTALLAIAVLVIGYGILVSTQAGYPAPFTAWLVVSSATITTSVLLVSLVRIVERLASQERDARAELDAAHRELASLNEDLEARVERQVSEIGSLNKLRRFLSPQVAEAVLRDGDESLQAHRNQIAVFFVDLRGFTSFASEADPEEVMEVLDEFYVTVGAALHHHEATVGSFAGDGVMAYFGDPVAHRDPAGGAVQMALDLRESMREVVGCWRRRGYDLGYGMGIAFGYATLGPIGFPDHTEYTAVGPVVNLGARLCAVARDGEALVDVRTYVALGGRVETEPRSVELRGFRAAVTAHNILAWRAERDRVLFPA